MDPQSPTLTTCAQLPRNDCSVAHDGGHPNTSTRIAFFLSFQEMIATQPTIVVSVGGEQTAIIVGDTRVVGPGIRVAIIKAYTRSVYTRDDFLPVFALCVTKGTHCILDIYAAYV